MHKTTDYKPLDVDGIAGLFSGCLPQGKAWNSKGDRESNFYKVIRSLSEDVRILEDRVYRLVTQWDVNITDDLIVEWETAVGIPDECRNLASDIATRRSDVLDKLRKIPIITIADYKALAESITGEPAANWDIRPGSVDFPSDPLYKFVLLITAPTVTSGAFDYPFGSGTLSVSNLAGAGTTATATVSDTTTMASGSIANISGANPSEYNGDYTITITSGTTFTYTFAGSGTTPATGTIIVNYGLEQTKLDMMASEGVYLFNHSTAFAGYPFAGNFRSAVLNCVLRKVTPANVAIVFDQ